MSGHGNGNGGNGLTAQQQDHLDRVTRRFVEDCSAKYVNGQRRHGGNLFAKPAVLTMAIEEALDLPVYLYTLRDQIHELLAAFDGLSRDEVRTRIAALVSTETD